jgi:hypothetical protein
MVAVMGDVFLWSITAMCRYTSKVKLFVQSMYAVCMYVWLYATKFFIFLLLVCWLYLIRWFLAYSGFILVCIYSSFALVWCGVVWCVSVVGGVFACSGVAVC